MRLVFSCSGFSSANLRLQPWLTFLEVGQRLAASGHDVTLATDGNPGPEGLPLPVQVFPSLRGTDASPIIRWLGEHPPDRAVVSISPFSLMTASWHKALNREKAWGYLGYPLYTRREFRAAWPQLTWSERWAYGRNLLVPAPLWRRRLRQHFAGVICQSQRTASRIGPTEIVGRPAAVAGSELHPTDKTHKPPFCFPLSAFCFCPSALRPPPSALRVVPPGIDLTLWHPAEHQANDPTEEVFLHVGSVKNIRGFSVLLEAMRRLPETIRLRVLARGMTEDGGRELQGRLESLGLGSRVAVRGGWLSAEELRAEIACALAVVFPFVLVPSELPVSVLEVIACGTPAIVSDIDGLPESVGDAGVAVPPGDVERLAAAMLELAGRPQKVAMLRDACARRRELFLDWEAVTARWAEALKL